MEQERYILTKNCELSDMNEEKKMKFEEQFPNLKYKYITPPIISPALSIIKVSEKDLMDNCINKQIVIEELKELINWCRYNKTYLGDLGDFIKVKYRKVGNKKFGVFLMDSCDNNYIFKNTIEKNGEFGIYLDESSYNKIKKNNFIENNNSAFFKNSFLNRWVKNYWDNFRILPKPIFGNIKIGTSLIRWINIDWRPALKPYDI